MSLCGLGLSCEPLPCEHGKEVRKEQCHLCDIKRQIMALTDMYKELSVRVCGFHDHKLRQIDENKKISAKVDEIIKLFLKGDSQLEDDVIRIERKIEKLEQQTVNISLLHSSNQGHETWKRGCEVLISGIQKELMELKRFQDITHEQYKNRKSPHKCPVCEGIGINCDIGEIRGLPIKSDKCHSCEGKGIVWG